MITKKLLPFPGWRLQNGVMNAGDGELERSSGACEKWAKLSGTGVVIGLLVEVLLAICHPAFDSLSAIWGGAISTAFVAASVFFELLFNNMEKRRSGELSRRSNERAAAAIERATQLEQEAAEARLETQQIKEKMAWRRLSKAQRGTLATALAGHPMTICVAHVGDDPEASLYREDIAKALEDAGAKVTYFSGYTSAVGVTLLMKPSGASRDRLGWALWNAGILTMPVHPSQENESFSTLRIVVGTKPPPF